MVYNTADLVKFEANDSTEAFGQSFKEGDVIEVLLGQNWNDEEGFGEGGPWGWGGYTTEYIEVIGERIWNEKGQQIFCKSDN